MPTPLTQEEHMASYGLQPRRRPSFNPLDREAVWGRQYPREHRDPRERREPPSVGMMPEGTVATTPDGKRLVFRGRLWHLLPEEMPKAPQGPVPTLWDHLED